MAKPRFGEIRPALNQSESSKLKLCCSSISCIHHAQAKYSYQKRRKANSGWSHVAKPRFGEIRPALNTFELKDGQKKSIQGSELKWYCGARVVWSLENLFIHKARLISTTRRIFCDALFVVLHQGSLLAWLRNCLSGLSMVCWSVGLFVSIVYSLFVCWYRLSFHCLSVASGE